MRIIGDLSSTEILQVEKTPDLGDARPFNGRFSVPVPEPGGVQVDKNSYILPVDGGDVSSLGMQRLLAQFPMYDNLIFNPLLTGSDIADLDLTAVGPTGEITRAQTGRGAGPSPVGTTPNMTAILPANDRIAPTRPGCLVTDTIDITGPTSGAGADEFLVWWKIYQFDTDDDIMGSTFGAATANVNDPAFKNITEIDQEPSDFEVYISHDDGVTWVGPIGRQEPTDMVTFDVSVRLAFINNSTTTKYYLATYAILF